jgi:hypothetical protein
MVFLVMRGLYRQRTLTGADVYEESNCLLGLVLSLVVLWDRSAYKGAEA